MERDRDAIVAEMNQLQKIRSGIVASAIGLLIISIMAPSMLIAVLRSIAWVCAGGITLVYASKAKQAGMEPKYGPAIVYFLVALVPLLRQR